MGTHYSHLRLEERRKLAKWLEAKMPIAEIADRLVRDASTIYRDIKRGFFTDDKLPYLNGLLRDESPVARRRSVCPAAQPRHPAMHGSGHQNRLPSLQQHNPKSLGSRTPAEVFCEKMMEEMTRSPYPDTNESRGSGIAHTKWVQRIACNKPGYLAGHALRQYSVKARNEYPNKTERTCSRS